jgi:hypothetical protein
MFLRNAGKDLPYQSSGLPSYSYMRKHMDASPLYVCNNIIILRIPTVLTIRLYSPLFDLCHFLVY